MEKRTIIINSLYLRINGNQGWIHVCIGTVSVSGFHSSTSKVSLGSINKSKIFSKIQPGNNGIQCSNSSINESGCLHVHCLVYNK